MVKSAGICPSFEDPIGAFHCGLALVAARSFKKLICSVEPPQDPTASDPKLTRFRSGAASVAGLDRPCRGRATGN